RRCRRAAAAAAAAAATDASLPPSRFPMDLRRLEVFAKVAELGSFSRAADALSLTQPTVSEHVRALEDELGVQLLDRLGRGATPEGPRRAGAEGRRARGHRPGRARVGGTQERDPRRREAGAPHRSRAGLGLA